MGVWPLQQRTFARLCSAGLRKCNPLRPLLYFLLLVGVMAWTQHSHASEYDPWFQVADQRFLAPYSGADWTYLKAQCWAESALDPRAVSPVGAQGICQFIPPTWGEVSRQLGMNASPFDPKANIIAAGFYMARLARGWTTERTQIERLRWAWASYNCGFGCVLKAQRRAMGTTRWHIVQAKLPRETRNYVTRIERKHKTYHRPVPVGYFDPIWLGRVCGSRLRCN